MGGWFQQPVAAGGLFTAALRLCQRPSRAADVLGGGRGVGPPAATGCTLCSPQQPVAAGGLLLVWGQAQRPGGAAVFFLRGRGMGPPAATGRVVDLDSTNPLLPGGAVRCSFEALPAPQQGGCCVAGGGASAPLQQRVVMDGWFPQPVAAGGAASCYGAGPAPRRGGCFFLEGPGSAPRQQRVVFCGGFQQPVAEGGPVWVFWGRVGRRRAATGNSVVYAPETRCPGVPLPHTHQNSAHHPKLPLFPTAPLLSPIYIQGGKAPPPPWTRPAPPKPIPRKTNKNLPIPPPNKHKGSSSCLDASNPRLTLFSQNLTPHPPPKQPKKAPPPTWT